MSLLPQGVLVTGGGTGIGQAVARSFAAAGSNVVVSGRRLDKLQETADHADAGGRIHCRTADVAERDSVQQLVSWATETLGRIDLLVHAAGVNIKTRTMHEMTPEQFDQVMAVNATGAYNTIWSVLPQMRERGEGVIVNISSISGKRAYNLGGIAYCASKFAATALGTAIGQEEAERGIRVTNVYPGEVNTPLLEQRPQPVSAERRATMLIPEDVAQMVMAVALLPPRAHVPEIVIKPTVQAYC